MENSTTRYVKQSHLVSLYCATATRNNSHTVLSATYPCMDDILLADIIQKMFKEIKKNMSCYRFRINFVIDSIMKNSQK